MRLTAPKEASWIIALILGLLAILLRYRVVVAPDMAGYSFEMLLIAFAILVIAPLVKGL
jgi:hypothetical protein